jgi:hypothetical protein
MTPSSDLVLILILVRVARIHRRAAAQRNCRSRRRRPDLRGRGRQRLHRQSKADQEGAGALLGVPFRSNPETCPVRALQAWISTLDDSSPAAPLFVSLNRHDRARLLPQTVALIVQRRCAAGLAGDPAGHGMRSGFVTTADGKRRRRAGNLESDAAQELRYGQTLTRARRRSGS